MIEDDRRVTSLLGLFWERSRGLHVRFVAAHADLSIRMLRRMLLWTSIRAIKVTGRDPTPRFLDNLQPDLLVILA
jgi:hypothetical protein